MHKEQIPRLVELGLLIIILLGNENNIFPALQHWPKLMVVPLIILVFGLLHNSEYGKRSRYGSLLFRENISQGFITASVMLVGLCCQYFTAFEKVPSQDEDASVGSILGVYMDYALAMFFATILYGILFLCNIDITFVTPVIILSLGFLQDHFVNINFVIPLAAVVLYFIIFYALNKLCPRSFTIGEAVMITQGVTFLLIDFALLLVIKGGYGRLLKDYDLTILESRNKESLLLSTLLATSVMISVCLSPVFYCLAQYAKTDNDNMIYSIAFYIGGILNTSAIFLPSAYLLLGMNPLWFLFSLINIRNVVLIMYWSILLLFAIVIVAWNADANKSEKGKIVQNIIIRKSFHLIAVLIFIPGIYYSPDFTKLASGVSIIAMVIFEYLRIFRICPFGETLNKYMISFVDGRDKGYVILTHIYLLLGFSLPVWIFSFDLSSHICPLLPYAGVISLGFGDSFASLIGKFYGNMKIHGSEKTVVGVIACLISQFLASIMILLVYNRHISFAVVLKVFAAVSCTALIEGVTSQIDNLILSPTLYATILFLRI